MPCDKSALFDFLSVLNEDLTKKITLVAAGGTAMTLLDLKSSTIDIDFTIPSIDRVQFEKALKNNPPGYKVDRWTDGCVFCQTLPNDYLENSIKIKEFSHISLRALQPVDIIVTKIGRLNARHRSLHSKGERLRGENQERALLVVQTYVGPEEEYIYHLNLVLDKFFKNRKGTKT
jgi:hypothetical protein